MEKIFEIWSEGYVITGGSGRALFHGKIKATSFKEACDILFDDDKFYNPKNLTYWGCKLFDNETDARKSFR